MIHKLKLSTIFQHIMWQLNRPFMCKFSNDNWINYLYVVSILVITLNQIRTNIAFGLRGRGWKRKEKKVSLFHCLDDMREEKEAKSEGNQSPLDPQFVSA